MLLVVLFSYYASFYTNCRTIHHALLSCYFPGILPSEYNEYNETRLFQRDQANLSSSSKISSEKNSYKNSSGSCSVKSSSSSSKLSGSSSSSKSGNATIGSVLAQNSMKSTFSDDQEDQVVSQTSIYMKYDLA